eukprot:g8891.t1
MFQMFFGGRGQGAEIVLQKLTNEPLQKRLETEKKVYLPGNHYMRLEVLTRNRDKVIWVTYEGPDTEYYEQAAAPNRIVGYARPSIYRGNVNDHEPGITHPYVDGLRSSSLGCRVLASKDGGMQLPRDCSNRCTDVALLNSLSSAMHNNGACDNAEAGAEWDMFCPEWVYDGGDCDPPLAAVESDAVIECLMTPPAGDFRRYGHTQCAKTETRGFNYYYDASDNRVIPSPLPEIENPRETEEIFCVSDYDFFPEMPTFALAHWPTVTTTTTTTDNPFGTAVLYRSLRVNLMAKPKTKFTKCCVAWIQNDPEHGSYCLAFGAVVGCFQEQQKVLQRRLKWLRDSPEYSDAQLNDYWQLNAKEAIDQPTSFLVDRHCCSGGGGGLVGPLDGDMNVTELLQCKTPKCNSLPGDFEVDSRGERIYKCPWQKDPDDIAELYQTQQPQKSISCYETRERDTFPPLTCQKREFTSYNFCQNDRTREGRRYAHCCVTTFITGRVAPLNELRTQARDLRVWSQCNTADGCNEPSLFNCPVVYDENAEAAYNARANPYVKPPPPDYGDAGEMFSPTVYEPDYLKDLYVEPEFGEGAAKEQVFNRIRPGAGFFRSIVEKYRPKELTDAQKKAIAAREKQQAAVQPYVTKYSRAIADAARKKGSTSESGEPQVAERERVAKDPVSAFGKKRPEYHETLVEYSQRTGTVPLALQNHQERIAAASGMASLQNSDGFSPDGTFRSLSDSGPAPPQAAPGSIDGARDGQGDGHEHNELERTEWRMRHEEAIKQRGGVLTEAERDSLFDVWDENHSPKHDRAASRQGGDRRSGGGGSNQLALMDDSMSSMDRGLEMTGGSKRLVRNRTGMLDAEEEGVEQILPQQLQDGAGGVVGGDVVPGAAFQGMAPPVVLPAAVSKALRKKKFNGRTVT